MIRTLKLWIPFTLLVGCVAANPKAEQEPSSAPGEDFFLHVNHSWMEANPIPAAYGSWGVFHEISERNKGVLRQILESAAADRESSDQLTRQLGSFWASGMDAKEAMLAAGYSGSMTPRVAITPAMRDEIRTLTGHQLSEAAPIAVKTLLAMVADEDKPDRIRIDAAKTILDRAGYVAPKAADAPSGAEKALHEMTRDELAERADRLQKEISERATLVVDADRAGSLN